MLVSFEWIERELSSREEQPVELSRLRCAKHPRWRIVRESCSIPSFLTSLPMGRGGAACVDFTCLLIRLSPSNRSQLVSLPQRSRPADDRSDGFDSSRCSFAVDPSPSERCRADCNASPASTQLVAAVTRSCSEIAVVATPSLRAAISAPSDLRVVLPALLLCVAAAAPPVKLCRSSRSFHLLMLGSLWCSPSLTTRIQPVLPASPRSLRFSSSWPINRWLSNRWMWPTRAYIYRQRRVQVPHPDRSTRCRCWAVCCRCRLAPTSADADRDLRLTKRRSASRPTHRLWPLLRRACRPARRMPALRIDLGGRESSNVSSPNKKRCGCISCRAQR